MKNVNTAVENTSAQLGARLAGALNNAGEKVQDSLEKVRELAAHAGEQIAAGAATVKQGASAAVDAARDKLVEGKEATADVVEDLLAEARSVAHRVGDYIKANPGKSFAAAALVGWLAMRRIRKPGRAVRH